MEYYIKEVRFNNHLKNEISNSLLFQYIKNDDIYLEKLLRRLLIIKKRNQQKSLLVFFHKWFINSYDIFKNNEKPKKINEIKSQRNNCLIKKNKNDSKNLIVNNIKVYKDKISKNKKLLNSILNKGSNNNKIGKKKANSYIIKNNSHIFYFPKNKIKNKIDNNNNSKNEKTSIIFNKSTPNFYHSNIIFYSKKNKKISPIKRNISNDNKKKSCLTYKEKIINKKNNLLKDKNIEPSRNNIAVKKNKSTNNKKINNKLISDFFKNLYNNEKSREEKMFKLNKRKEDNINSIYTFTPKLIPNKNNQKYLNNLIDKLFVNNIIDNINNKIINNNQTNNNINKFNDLNNKADQLDIVLEENRKNNYNLNFISRLNEYEKRKKINLEKIKNDVYLNEKKKNLDENYYNNNEKYNIEDYHLLNSTYSYFSNKKRNIEKIKKDIFDEQGITFKPKLNNKFNEKIINNYNYLNNEAYLNKKNEKIFDYLSYKDKECTFQPKINYIDLSHNNSNDMNVSQRLFGYQNKYREKLDLMRSKYCNFTFKPKISKNTDVILNKKKLIQNLKEQIKCNIPYNNRDLIFNQNELCANEEKKIESNEMSQNNNEIISDINENNELNINKNDNPINNSFSNKVNNNLIYIEDNIQEKENNNEFNNNNDNYNNYIKDFKQFLNRNDRSRDKDKINNNKKIMNFNYYNNFL